LAVVHQQAREVAGGDRVALLVAVVADDGDGAAPALVVDDADHARRTGEDGLALGGAGLEELDDARKAVGDVLTGDAARVESTHGELGAGLTDGLGGDDAHRLAELDGATSGERAPVARGADAVDGLTR